MPKEELHIKKNIRKKSIPIIQQNLKLIDFYSKNSKIIGQLSDALESSGIKKEQLLEIIEKKDILLSVPASVFNNNLSPLEAVCQYLKEGGRSIKETSSLLKRDSKTIWTTLSNASKKSVLLDKSSDCLIPISIISDRKLSALENISSYMKDSLGIRLSDIARLLGKNKNTIWTAYHRSKEKEKNG